MRERERERSLAIHRESKQVSTKKVLSEKKKAIVNEKL